MMDENDNSSTNRVVYNVRMILRNQFVGVSFVLRDSLPGVIFEVSIHRSEIRLLCERLLSLLEKPDGAVAMIEGAYAGPPPDESELI